MHVNCSVNICTEYFQCDLMFHPAAELPINCPQGKEYSQCTAHCVPTCSNRNPICTRICTPGCICASGTILDEEIGQCVIQIDCSSECRPVNTTSCDNLERKHCDRHDLVWVP